MTATRTEAPGVTGWRNAIMVMFALAGMTVSTWGPRLASIRAALGVDDRAIGFVLAGVTVGSILGMTLSSAMLGRLGVRRAILAPFGAVSTGLALLGLGGDLLASLPVTIAGFLAVGFGIGAVDVIINVEGSAVERTARRTLMPLMHSAWSAGAIIGAGIGALSAALGIRVAVQFLAEAGVVALAAILAVRYLPVTQPAEERAPVAPLLRRVREWAVGWVDWRLLLIGLVMLGVELGEGSANSWLTLAARDGHHLTDAVAAAYFTAFAAAETLARIAGGPLVDRIGRVGAVRMTTAMGVLGVLLFILAANPVILLLGVLLWAVGVSMGFPLGMSAAAESGTNSAARVSVVASIGYLANLAGPPVIGVLSQRAGLLHALWLILALLVAASALAGALAHRPAPAT